MNIHERCTSMYLIQAVGLAFLMYTVKPLCRMKSVKNVQNLKQLWRKIIARWNLLKENWLRSNLNLWKNRGKCWRKNRKWRNGKKTESKKNKKSSSTRKMQDLVCLFHSTKFDVHCYGIGIKMLPYMAVISLGKERHKLRSYPSACGTFVSYFSGVS